MRNKSILVLVMTCLGLMLAPANGFSAKDCRQAKKLRLPRLALDTEVFSSEKPALSYKTEGVRYDLTCDDISPSAGTIIQHDQIGYTFYDVQHHSSMGRMISVTDDGYRHFSWMFTEGPYGSFYRHVDANCKDPQNSFLGQTHADGGIEKNAGYCVQTHLHDGTSVIVHHRSSGTPTDPCWYTMLTVDDGLCNGSFGRHWDIPDYIHGSWWTDHAYWPRAGMLYDPEDGKDYLHVVLSEPDVGPNERFLGYERCWFDAGDTLVCESYVGGSTATYRIPEGTYASADTLPISLLDTVGYWTSYPAVAVSPVSQRVAIVLRCRVDPVSGDYWDDVCYVESMNNGDDWVDGTNWPPVKHNVTDFGYSGNDRPCDLSACYDYQDSLHIIYSTYGFDPQEPGYILSDVSRLYHWSKKSGITRIASAVWEDTDPGSYSPNIAKVSISAQDPVNLSRDDSVYLYCVWSQFDTADNAANGYTNGDLYGCGSLDGGAAWGQPFNLTNTRTPGCAPGECLSENWPSLARNMYDGDLHVQYVCDRDAGGVIYNEGQWTSNPVMYLHLSGWDVSLAARGEFRMDEPESWFDPPLKVPHGGSKTLMMTLFSVGNIDLQYNVLSDNNCIWGDRTGSLPPGDSISLSFTVEGSGLCDSTFIDGNIILITNQGGQKIDTLPVQAVVADDYYECPVDSQTYAILENGILRLYANANGEIRIHDMGTFPDTVHEVFFEGSIMVATTLAGDTLVGRFMLNDHHTGARDKLYLYDCTGDRYLAYEDRVSTVYTKNIFIHDLEPPADHQWFWWEVSNQIVFFNQEVPEIYRRSVIQNVKVRRHDPPGWWPDQSPFLQYEDTYIGVVADIDCPYDTFAQQNGRNPAGYDQENHIAWQGGWDYTGAHPQYNSYYGGIALVDTRMPGDSTVPYGSQNVRNDEYLYPQDGWGWRDGELYRLGSTAGYNVDDPDSIVDRSWVLTANKINAGSDPDAEARFSVLYVVAPDGLAQLVECVDSVRALITEESAGYVALCGDIHYDHTVNLGDVVELIHYLYKGTGTPSCPLDRSDVDSNGIIDLGDLVFLLNWLFKNNPAGSRPDPDCPGVWGP